MQTDTVPAEPWRLAFALGVTQLISWGSIYYAFALLIDPLAQAVAADRATVVGAFSVALLVAGLMSAPIGSLIDRVGGRWVMSAGSAFGALLLAALAHVDSVLQLYLVWAGLGAVMAATLYDPAFAVLAQAFHNHQRKAITIVTLFGGFASTVFWPLTQALVASIGWQQALFVLALINLLVCLPLHVWLLPPRGTAQPRAEGTAVDKSALPSVLRDPAFWWLSAAFTGNALVFSAVSVHLIPLLSGKGMSLAEAAWIGALIGPMQVLGRLLEFGFLSKVPPSRVGAIAMWLLPLSLALLATLSGAGPAYALFALLYGTGNGVMTIVRGALPAELFGRANYGAVNGAMATPVLVAKAAGPTVASLVLAAFAGPLHLLLFLAAVGAVSAGLFTLTVLRRSASKRDAVILTP